MPPADSTTLTRRAALRTAGVGLAGLAGCAAFGRQGPDLRIHNSSGQNAHTVRVRVVETGTGEPRYDHTVTVDPNGEVDLADRAFHPPEPVTVKAHLQIAEDGVDYEKWTRPFDVGEGSGFDYLFVGVTLCGAFLWRVHRAGGDKSSGEVDC